MAGTAHAFLKHQQRELVVQFVQGDEHFRAVIVREVWHQEHQVSDRIQMLLALSAASARSIISAFACYPRARNRGASGIRRDSNLRSPIRSQVVKRAYSLRRNIVVPMATSAVGFHHN